MLFVCMFSLKLFVSAASDGERVLIEFLISSTCGFCLAGAADIDFSAGVRSMGSQAQTSRNLQTNPPQSQSQSQSLTICHLCCAVSGAYLLCSSDGDGAVWG